MQPSVYCDRCCPHRLSPRRGRNADQAAAPAADTVHETAGYSRDQAGSLTLTPIVTTVAARKRDVDVMVLDPG
jgi:hypothetical protein